MIDRLQLQKKKKAERQKSKKKSHAAHNEFNLTHRKLVTGLEKLDLKNCMEGQKGKNIYNIIISFAAPKCVK